MVRKAAATDMDGVEKSYMDLLAYEKEHEAFTVWQAGVYPTRATAEEGLKTGSLYVIEQAGEICASMLLNQIQPPEYRQIKWKHQVKEENVLVVHLLCVPPLKSGHGYGTEMMQFAVQKGKKMGCRTIRLDTGKQNTPAVALYTKLGFALAGTASMAIGGAIEHHNHLFFELNIDETI